MNIFIVGASGRMGGELIKLIEGNKRLKLAGGLSRKTRAKFVSRLPEKTSGIDVVIDFSSPGIFSETISWCVKHKLPLVSGTTGLTTENKKQITAAGKTIPILWAPNTAPGVHWVKRIFSQLGLPANADVQIVETHHVRKKDKPSGTALFLQEALIKHKKDVPPPLAIRGGGVFGIHRIDIMLEEETITIEHSALSRTLFARGALDAAQWLKKKKPGVYTMENFIS